MMRFLVFAGNNYHPAGGWADFKGEAETRDAASYILTFSNHDWWHIVDTKTGDIVEDSNTRRKSTPELFDDARQALIRAGASS